MVKTYFENYYGAVSVKRASVNDVLSVRKMFMPFKLESKLARVGGEASGGEPQGNDLRQYQRSVFNTLGSKFYFNRDDFQNPSCLKNSATVYKHLGFLLLPLKINQ